jgi:C4-dicarboxylate-specific signal transduction histidine kinase
MRLHLSRSEQPPVFVAVVQDMTEHRQRLAELIHASKLVTLGQMATGVAHELNQPLNIIKMAVESATERAQAGRIDGEYLLKKLNRVSAQVERAAGIIDHMQIFGRRPTDKPQEIDPREAVNGALTLMRQQLRLEDIRIETRLPQECREVRGHAVQLEQVLLNLLRNACDAIVAKRNSPGDPRRVTVVVEDTGPADKITLTVQDTGGGIPENVFDRIFEPFFTTKEVGKGTGLGLSISYGIIHDMNGTMEVANTEEGARFTITLPAVGRWTASTVRAMGPRPASVGPQGDVDD